MCYYQFSCFYAQTCTTNMRRVTHRVLNFQSVKITDMKSTPFSHRASCKGRLNFKNAEALLSLLGLCKMKNFKLMNLKGH